jgi:hypothetical protein
MTRREPLFSGLVAMPENLMRRVMCSHSYRGKRPAVPPRGGRTKVEAEPMFVVSGTDIRAWTGPQPERFPEECLPWRSFQAAH